jgi:Catalytic LigB subunit of aromatic ring-opening dioxygenase
MSEVIAVAGTSHSPMLAMEPDKMWRLRAHSDAEEAELLDAEGQIVSFQELAANANGRYDKELSLQVWDAKYGDALACVDRLRRDLIELAPDLLLVIGDDQEELFTARNQPAIAVYHGEAISMHQPLETPSPPLIEVQRNLGMNGGVYPGDSAAARHIIGALLTRHFDVATSSETEAGGGFGHAFAWVVGRLLKDVTVPMVPLILNTYYPPNQPTPARCYDLGCALAEAIESMPGDRRVAVVASGGLSHFVVNEELDRRILEAMRTHDADVLRSLPVRQLNSGTSEVRNWVAALGAGRHLTHRWSTYIPAWRSPAGTGVGLAFGLWS